MEKKLTLLKGGTCQIRKVLGGERMHAEVDLQKRLSTVFSHFDGQHCFIFNLLFPNLNTYEISVYSFPAQRLTLSFFVIVSKLMLNIFFRHYF